jgi:formate dehydrogenase major subunit
MHYDSAEEIFNEMRTLVPSYAGITYERIDKTGLQWPCPDTDHPGTQFLHANGFTRGKGLLQGIEYEAPAELCSDEYPILLTTGRMLYHYNIMTRHSANLEGCARTSSPRSTRSTPSASSSAKATWRGSARDGARSRRT